MFVKRSKKRKDTVSSEENDNEENYSTINFQVEFPTQIGETLYIIGNVEELGNWEEERAEKMIKLDEKSLIWESMYPLECPVGMTINYKYLICDKSGNKTMEKLPNNLERTITTKKPGSYIILNKKGDFSRKITYVGKERRDLERKMSRIFFNVANMSNNESQNEENDKDIKNLKFNFGKQEEESEYVTNLSPTDLISYENNKANFDTYDKIPDFDYTQKITSSDRVILVTIFLPLSVKKNKKDEYEIFEDENSILLLYLNKLKKNKSINLIWVGMLKNYFEFEEEEIDQIEDLLSVNDYYIIRPKKGDWQLFIYFIQRIMSPLFYNSSFSPDEEAFADNKRYFDAFYNVSKSYYDIISVNYLDNDFITLFNLGLCLVPNLIMNKKYNAHIGLYIQETLPSSDVIKAFPYYQEMIKSILLCDVIGFHDFTAARNFCTILKRFLGIFNEITKKGIISLSYLGRNIIIHIKQPQLNLDLVTELTNHDEFKTYDKEYEKKYGNNELTVISFDYIFIINAIFVKLKAIDLFLSNHKELIGKCNFIMWIKEFELEVDEEEEEKEDEEEEEEEDEEEEEEEEEDDEDEENEKRKKNRKKKKSHKKVKSLLSIKQNNENDNRKIEKYKQKIEQEINKLKKKYNDENIIAVEFASDEQTFNIFRRLALFKHSNIFLYSFFLNGQGIYVKEFLSMKNENSKKYGAIVNENMAFMGLRSIIKVNPFDSDIIAKALNQINSWTVNNLRYESDIKSLKKNSTEKWIKGFLLDMKRVMLNDSNNKSKIGLGKDIAIMKLNENFRQLRKSKLTKYFKNSKSRLLIFNYENTLQDFEETNGDNSNILDNKSKKNYTKRIIKIISSFCEDPENMVFIISKYNFESLNKIFGKVKNLGICGENGFFYKYPNKKEVIPLIKNIDWSWRETVVKIMKMFSERAEGSKVIENKSNIAWSYTDNYFGNDLADELKTHLSTILNTPTLEISILNNGILEVKPKNVNKGAFLAKILQDKFVEKKFDLIFIVGCDDTDEEMFKYLQSAKKYFHNFVNKIRIVSTTINKHTSLAHYYFNEINDCIENLELISKGKYKDSDDDFDDEPKKPIFHFKEDDD